MINFRQIEAFRAVMLSGSMTQAAKDLHTSQPHISRVIGQLERRIGLKLFDRQLSKLIPTAEGQVFFRDVELTFSAIRGLEDAAANIKKRGAGRLRIASVPSMAIAVVPDAIQRFSESCPDVDVSLQVADSLTVCQWLAGGFVDVGISSEIYNATGVSVETLARNVGVCIAPKTHRLASRKRPLGPADLAGETFLSLKSSDVTRKQIDEACLIDGREKRVLAYESHFAAAICRMVSRGMGISIANPLVARAYSDQLAVLRFQPAITFETYIVYPLNSPVNMFAKTFANHLFDTIKD